MEKKSTCLHLLRRRNYVSFRAEWVKTVTCNIIDMENSIALSPNYNYPCRSTFKEMELLYKAYHVLLFYFSYF